MSLSTLRVRTYGDPCLRVKCTPVKEVGPSERMVIQAMIETMYQAKGVGLAAPQVGITQRLFVIDIGDGPMAVINPQILKKSGSDVQEEGCLCVPEVAIAVQRAEQVTVKYSDENNEPVTLTCSGLLARAFQHETDHLNGVLIVDHASDEELDKYKEQLARLEAENKQ